MLISALLMHLPIVILCVHAVMSSSFATTWTIPGQSPLPMGFFRQEYWSG